MDGDKYAPFLRWLLDDSSLDDGEKADFAILFLQEIAAGPLPAPGDLDDIRHALPYKEDAKIFVPTIHRGQRKLFISELRFLNEVVAVDSDARFVVYAGAAPGRHTSYLASLFPTLKFILIDPNVFELQPVSGVGTREMWRAPDGRLGVASVGECARIMESARDAPEQIVTIRDLMTIDMARAVRAAVPDAYFISDVRTNMIRAVDFSYKYSDNGCPGTFSVVWNLCAQHNWVRIIEPPAALLKFRYPFYAEWGGATEGQAALLSRDMIAMSRRPPYARDFALALDYGVDFTRVFETHELEYLAGRLQVQAWAGEMSTESRLVTRGDAEIANYGRITEYENKYYYYNVLERGLLPHINPNADKQLGFDHCADCAIENEAWERYIAVVGGPTAKSVREYVADLCKALGMRHGLHVMTHGHLRDDPRPLMKLKQRAYRSPARRKFVPSGPIL